jgi:hypothetical protein
MRTGLAIRNMGMFKAIQNMAMFKAIKNMDMFMAIRNRDMFMAKNTQRDIEKWKKHEGRLEQG